MQQLVKKLSQDYEYVSLLGTDVRGKNYGVQKKGVDYSDSIWTERGFVIRVFNGTGYSEYSFNQIDFERLDELTEKIKENLNRSISEVNSSYYKINEYPLIREDNIKQSYQGEVEILPTEVTSEEKFKRLTEIKDNALKLSNYLVDFRIKYEDVHTSKLFISNNKELEQSYVWSQGYLIAIIKKDNIIKYYYDGFSGLKGVELISEMEECYTNTVNNAEKLLEAERIEPGNYDVICTPDVAGIIAHEAFGHGVEMDMFVKNRAKAVEYIDKQVASEKVTMHDNAATTRHVSSYLFDDEGVPGKDTIIIDKGILKTGISDTLSALKLGKEPSGNGRRESFERKAYARMTNTYFAAGEDNLEDMIVSIDYGYLLDTARSGMEDPKNWGIQCVVAIGKEIENGKLTGRIVSPVIMTGYVPELLKNISMISKEVDLFGGGACGKGYKEYVKVSSGGPYIKTRARLG